jgi:hypothetical protein
MKKLNYKVIDLVESYNFQINFISIGAHTKKLQFFENELNPIAVWYGGWECTVLPLGQGRSQDSNMGGNQL